MRKSFRAIIVLILITFAFASCKSKLHVAKMVPADAVFVGYMNTKSLLDKLPYSDVKATQMYKDIAADTSLPDWGKKMLENPEQSGIDLEKGLLAFVHKGSGNSVNMVVEGAVKSASDFEKFNKSLDPSAQATKEKNINVLVLKNQSVVGWNDKDFVYVINSDADPSEFENFSDSTLPKLPKGNIEEAKAYCISLFSLPEDSSLAGDKRFAKLMDEKGDVKVWLNNESMFNMIPQLGMLSMLKINDLIKDARSTYVINFENGKIELDQKAYLNKQLFDIAKKYSGDNVSADQISRIPSNNIAAFMAFNYKPEGIKEVLKLLGMDGMANMYLGQMGFTLDEITGAQNGKLSVSVSDLDLSKPEGATGMNDSDFNVLVAVGVGDKAKFDKVLNTIKGFMGTEPDSSINIISNEKELAIANHASFANSYLEGKSGNKPEWASAVTGHPFGLYLDLNQIIKKTGSKSMDENEKAMFEKSMAFWKNVISTGGDANDNALSYKTEVNLMDGNTNSLKQLNTYIDQIYQIDKKRRASSSASLDSLLTAPPVDTVHTP